MATLRLDWRACAGNSAYDCATARVPLDYSKPRGRSIRLAVVKRKATGPGRRIGTLFFNPGGPGGPGTVQMPQDYGSFPKKVRERFDIVSWDPRGIGNSTAVNCFTSPEEAEAWNASKPAGFPVGRQERQAWISAYRKLGRLCDERDPELLRHVSTEDTARDLDQLRRAVGDPRLTYCGISYGTILGATYANLFPSRVRAMTLDSNIAPTAWTNRANDDARLPTFLRMGSDRSAAATLDQFLKLCGSHPAQCAFSAGSPQATRKKFDQVTARLRKHPVGTWTYARTVADAINSLYIVHPGWTRLGVNLQDLWRGREPQPAAAQDTSSLPYPIPYTGEEQAGAVFYGDSPNPRDPRVYHPIEEASAARTGDAGRFWTWAAEPCATWPATAANRYTGPWNKPTANPILVVGTAYDPSTPYQDAQAMAKELADARLLTNTGYGHTALLNPSSCINAHASRYFIGFLLRGYPGFQAGEETKLLRSRAGEAGSSAGRTGVHRPPADSRCFQGI